MPATDDHPNLTPLFGIQSVTSVTQTSPQVRHKNGALPGGAWASQLPHWGRLLARTAPGGGGGPPSPRQAPLLGKGAGGRSTLTTPLTAWEPPLAGHAALGGAWRP